jgi:NAD(P)-dependent dehydrogenase (short-subunit alcohol dehydrogenase family)
MNRVALITGGTSGIGLATARELVAAGARVVVVGRDAAKGERAIGELGELASFEPADVARGQDVARVVDAVLTRWGRLDWAVNAAADGDVRRAPVAEITDAEWERAIAVDLTGIWSCMRREITAMLATGGGAIVNVSSVNGLSGTPLAAAYCAAKHGVNGLSKTAAIEYASRGIRINVVCPGAHRTPMLAGVFETVSPGDPARAEAMYVQHIPAGRIAEPVECARTIAWLLSDAASYVTGAVLTVDGGLSAG